jgi:hypothetical protein
MNPQSSLQTSITQGNALKPFRFSCIVTFLLQLKDLLLPIGCLASR